jgi:hypothetical protein
MFVRMAAYVDEVVGRNQRIFSAVAPTVMLIALWSVTHRYKGISGDAALYAVQAMARIHPNLGADLFLQSTSQDKYTVFSPFYGWCIGFLGLRNAALTLAVAFKVWLFAAAWSLARALTDNGVALMAIALLIVTLGTYGAYAVFRYAEDYLTARSAAEALVVTALALHFSGLKASAVIISLLALLVHPLMALPGVLVLACLWCPLRINIASAAAGILACLGMAFSAVHASSGGGLLTVIDADWCQMVRERSVFLFLQYWQIGDWAQNTRPFLSLTLAAMVLANERARSLCIASMLVGATGLVIAFIASTLGPIAILMQGQAWRWEWIACFVSVLLLAPSAAAIYRDTRCGPLCAILLVAGWVIVPPGGTLSLAIALGVWAARDRIDLRIAAGLRWAALALGLVLAAWALVDIWHAAFASSDPGRSSLLVSRIRNILGLPVVAIPLALGLARGIGKLRSHTILALVSLFLGAAAARLLPDSLHDQQHDGTGAEIREFMGWRAVIAPTSNVWVVPSHNSATFAWFILDRPSYLSVDQSAGVVFSREVAMEVKRRSEVLLPMMPPDWRLLTGNRSSEAYANPSAALPLTADRLKSVCQDPQLGFVVAKESVSADRMQHEQRGDWQGWNLYDCRDFRIPGPAT